MDKEQEKRRLKAQLEKLEALRKAFPDGPTHQNILELIGELERELRTLGE